MKTTNPPTRNSRDYYRSLITNHYPATPKPSEGGPLPRRSFSEGGSLLTVLVLALCCFALSPAPKAFGVLPSPTPDGGYPGNNTAEGQNALQSLTSGLNNAGIGFRALFKDTSGGNNTATGAQTLYSNTTGSANTANGYVALTSNTTGASNTAIGSGALHGNTTASHNTATGYISLYNNTTGSFNVADGDRALYTNTTGTQNVATGYQALGLNTTGSENTADGYRALYNNMTGDANAANGYSALSNNTSGYSNTANGRGALESNSTGYYNTANGEAALVNNTAGYENTADGRAALFNNDIGYQNTAIGFQALDGNSSGSDNIVMGFEAGTNLTTGSFNIDIGNAGVAAESDTIRIGTQGTQAATFIAGIYGVTASGGAAVYINSSGQLGTATSSARFKRDIHGMDKASETVLALRPVTFRYKPELDPNGVPQFGLVAEEVEKVNPDLVVRDAEGKPYTVRYEAVNAMLLNEFLKEHRTVQEQETAISQLKSTVAKQEATMAQLKQDFETKLVEQHKQIKALTSGLEKVNNQLEPNKAAPQMVLNSQ